MLRRDNPDDSVIRDLAEALEDIKTAASQNMSLYGGAHDMAGWALEEHKDRIEKSKNKLDARNG